MSPPCVGRGEFGKTFCKETPRTVGHWAKEAPDSEPDLEGDTLPRDISYGSDIATVHTLRRLIAEGTARIRSLTKRNDGDLIIACTEIGEADVRGIGKEVGRHDDSPS